MDVKCLIVFFFPFKNSDQIPYINLQLHSAHFPKCVNAGNGDTASFTLRTYSLLITLLAKMHINIPLLLRVRTLPGTAKVVVQL